MHIVDFDDARTGASARARARAASSARIERRRQQQSHRRARDAREAGIARGNSMPFSRKALARNVSTRAGTRYPREWDAEDSFGFDDYGEYGYDRRDTSAGVGWRAVSSRHGRNAPAPRGRRDDWTSRNGRGAFDGAYNAYGDPYDDPYDDPYAEDDAEDEEVHAQEGWIKRFQRNNRKRRAERMANRAIDDGAAASEGGPRAALFEMKMGNQHRSLVRVQRTSKTEGKRGLGLGLPSLSMPPLAVRILLGILLCMVLTVAFIYPAAKNYYVAVREHAKAEVAVQVAQERNAILEKDVAALSTPEGIEDRVRSEFGWIKEGENAVVVSGVEDTNDGIKRLEELPAVEMVRAPETWYSKTLDPLFGYTS